MPVSLLSAYEYNNAVLNDLQQICLPLQKEFKFTLLTYRKVTNDGNLLHLSTNRDWLNYSAEHEYWTSTTSSKRINAATTNKIIHYPWQEIPPKNDDVYTSMYNLNIWNGITLYEKTASGVSLWAFATSRENTEIKDFYMENIEILYHFINYFKYKAKDIIYRPPKSSYIQALHLLTSPSTDDILTDAKENFLNQTPVKKYFIEIGNKLYSLTQREREVITLLKKSKTAKEISKELLISNRTVEHHIQNLRCKFDVSTTSTMIELLENPLLENIG